MKIDTSQIWVQTASGRKMYPANPTPESVCIEDIAHNLSLINRYNGATCRPYSVAEHSLLLERWAAKRGFGLLTRLNFLLHDAAEAYLQDITGPLQPLAPGLKSLEEELLPKLHSILGVPYLTNRKFIRSADKSLCLNERAKLHPNHDPKIMWTADTDGLKPLDIPDSWWNPADWRQHRFAFLANFGNLKESYLHQINE